MRKYDTNALANNYIKKWNPTGDLDKRLKVFNDDFEKWLSQIPENAIPVVLNLLDHFYYYSHRKTNELLACLHEMLVSDYQVSEDDTIYTFIKSHTGKSNSSNDYWTEYKGINQLNKEICIIDINKITIEQWAGINNIVFIDDCCGTGKTFTEFLSESLERYIEKKIYFVSIHIMHEAEIFINRFASDNNLHIYLINAMIQEKAFSNSCFGSGHEEAKDLITETSQGFGIPNREILGYKASESLMAFYNNTPNNTLGMLRYDTDTYFSIFPRDKTTKPSWKNLGANKRSKKTQNYNAFSRSRYDE